MLSIVRPSARLLRRFFRIALCLLIATHLAVPPRLGAMIGEFTVKDEAELGRKFSLYVRSSFPVVDDPEIDGYIRYLVARVASSMPPQPFPITSGVLRNNAMNAFAGPGGQLFVFTGLILGVQNESELAGVIAHELAHVSQRHLAQRMQRSQIMGIAGMLGMVAGAFLGSDAGQALMAGSQAAVQTAQLKYSRDDEREADQVGMNYLVDSGFPPQGMPDSFLRIKKSKWISSGSMPSYFSTHPGLDERIGYLEDRVRALPAAIRTRPEDNRRLRRVQTLLRARYTPPQEALVYFSREGGDCLDLLGKAIVLQALNRMHDAEGAFCEALTCSEDDSLFKREAGRFYYTQGDFAAAGKLLQEAVLRNPQDLVALFYYALVLSKQGQKEQSIQYMNRVLSALPDSAEVHYFFSRIYAEQNEIFLAHVHLCYSEIYSNDAPKARLRMEQVRRIASTEEQQATLAKLEEAYAERSQFWRGGG